MLLSKNNLKKFAKRSGTSVGILVLSFAVGLILVRAYAASYAQAQEAENGVLQNTAARCQDQTASNGQSVRFGATTCSPITAMYTNPVKLSTADPGVLKWDNRYYMVSTAGVPTFTIWTSDDLVNWTSSGKAVFNGTHPWGVDRFWAPEPHQLNNGRFAVYYSAADKNSGRLSVGVATADSILGPYADLGKPLVNESFGVIDVNYFSDAGRQYLYWKEDGGNTRIFAQELNEAGTGFIGARTVVLQKGLAWEGAKGIEGPWVTKHDDQYYLFYSGELFSSDLYSIGVARSNTPLSTFTKRGDPILRSGNRWKGPGHNSVVHAGANDYMVYHAWDGKAGVGGRFGLVDKITWASNGWPSVASGKPTETPQPYPQ